MSEHEYTTYPREFVTYKWYRPLLVGMLGFIIMFAIQFVLVLAAAIVAGDASIFNNLDGYQNLNITNPFRALVTLGGVAAMLPAIAIAIRGVGGRPFSSLSSSRGNWFAPTDDDLGPYNERFGARVAGRSASEHMPAGQRSAGFSAGVTGDDALRNDAGNMPLFPNGPQHRREQHADSR